MTVKKLTPEFIKRIIAEEMSKFGDMEDTKDRADDTEEVDAGEYADSLEKHIDFVKALKIEEGRVMRRLQKIREAKQLTLKKIVVHTSRPRMK
jgi:hypothetical protein